MFLLATGERGLGLETVKRLTAKEFEFYWHCQQAVARLQDNDARADAIKERDLRRTLRLEEQGRLDTQESQPFDPATASPQEIEAWIKRMQG